jgi:hypothetical protein
MPAQTTDESFEPEVEDRSMRVAEYLLAIIAAAAAVILTVVR